MSLLAPGFGCALLSACSPPLAPSVINQRELAQNQAEWQRAAVHSYSFDLEVDAMILTSPVHVVVRGDTVAGVVDLNSGAALPLADGQTIDGLFKQIAAALQWPDFTVAVTYDAQRGFPTLIDENGGAPDRGARYIVTNWAAGP